MYLKNPDQVRKERIRIWFFHGRNPEKSFFTNQFNFGIVTIRTEVLCSGFMQGALGLWDSLKPDSRQEFGRKNGIKGKKSSKRLAGKRHKRQKEQQAFGR